jgi:hypothetical protein
MANGIDFVIGGRDQAKPAMSSVERGLSRLEKKTNSVKNATLGLMAAMVRLSLYSLRFARRWH